MSQVGAIQNQSISSNALRLRKTLGSWREVLNAYTWETIRAEYWRRHNEPVVADYVQAMADAYRLQLKEGQQEVEL